MHHLSRPSGLLKCPLITPVYFLIYTNHLTHLSTTMCLPYMLQTLPSPLRHVVSSVWSRNSSWIKHTSLRCRDELPSLFSVPVHTLKHFTLKWTCIPFCRLEKGIFDLEYKVIFQGLMKRSAFSRLQNTRQATMPFEGLWSTHKRANATLLCLQACYFLFRSW